MDRHYLPDMPAGTSASNVSSNIVQIMSAPAYVPPGWPAQVRPTRRSDWLGGDSHRYLLDCCPPDFRAYRVLRNHPVVAGTVPRHFVNGQHEASQRGLAAVRTSISEHVDAAVVEAATRAWLEQGLGSPAPAEPWLIGEALQGQVFVRKL